MKEHQRRTSPKPSHKGVTSNKSAQDIWIDTCGSEEEQSNHRSPLPLPHQNRHKDPSSRHKGREHSPKRSRSLKRSKSLNRSKSSKRSKSPKRSKSQKRSRSPKRSRSIKRSRSRSRPKSDRDWEKWSEDDKSYSSKSHGSGGLSAEWIKWSEEDDESYSSKSLGTGDLIAKWEKFNEEDDKSYSSKSLGGSGDLSVKSLGSLGTRTPKRLGSRGQKHGSSGDLSVKSLGCRGSRTPRKTKEDHLRLQKKAPSSSPGFRMTRRAKEDMDARRKGNERDRSKSPAPGADYSRRSPRSRDKKHSNKSKEKKRNRATTPGAENISKNNQGTRLYLSKNVSNNDDEFHDGDGDATFNKRREQHSANKRREHPPTTAKVGSTMPSDLRQPISEPHDLPLAAAKAVDEESNEEIIQKQVQQQVQAVLDKMKSDKRKEEPEITVRMDDEETHGSNSETLQGSRSKCCTPRRMGLVALLLIVAGGAAATATVLVLRKLRNEMNTTPDVTSAPTATQVPDVITATPSGSPSLPYVAFEPPSEEDCEAVQNLQPVEGQGELEVMSFDISIEVVLDDEGNYAGQMATLIMQVQKELLPELAGCIQPSRRALRENTPFLRRSRQLENPPYPIANANVTGEFDIDAYCSADKPQPCRRATLTVEVYVREGAETAYIMPIIKYVFEPPGREALADKLQLPNDVFEEVTLVDVEINVATNAPTLAQSDMPSIVPSMSPSTQPSSSPSSTASRPSFTATENPSVAPVIGPTTEEPTRSPTKTPSVTPTLSPSSQPTPIQTPGPTDPPALAPTPAPVVASTPPPTSPPTKQPTTNPTPGPTSSPSSTPSSTPSGTPSGTPSDAPTSTPSDTPSSRPSPTPSHSPSTTAPSYLPSTTAPSYLPTVNQSDAPSRSPTMLPSTSPSAGPTTSSTSASTPSYR
mmetsp:Transcript_42275/g.102178  ORF Transcript_42275/g.102178 Transcript_42275/m.102178 type:complete len:922 (+) Transcript_42275:304-3069(+)